MHLHYKDQFVNVLQGNSRCLFRESYETHKYTAWAKCRCSSCDESARSKSVTSKISKRSEGLKRVHIRKHKQFIIETLFSSGSTLYFAVSAPLPVLSLVYIRGSQIVVQEPLEVS
jgi:hypothetical protein